MAFFFNGLGCGRPPGKTINNVKKHNKEFANLIPLIRGDAPLIIDKLEILRLGLSREKQYSISRERKHTKYPDDDDDDYPIKISYRYNFGCQPYNFAERQEEFSAEIIDTVNYLFFSDELQLNALSIHFALGDELETYAVFAVSDDHWYALGVYCFDPNNPSEMRGLEIFQRDGDYVEDLGGNYWLVMRFVNRY
jgi:hypothetical protein